MSIQYTRLGELCHFYARILTAEYAETTVSTSPVNFETLGHLKPLFCLCEHRPARFEIVK